MIDTVDTSGTVAVGKYYSQDQQDALKIEASVLSPEKDTKHKELEVAVGKQFVEMFGSLLNPAQKKYLMDASVIVTNPEDQLHIADEVIEHPREIDKGIAQIGGRLYTAYSPVGGWRPGNWPGGVAFSNGFTFVGKKTDDEYLSLDVGLEKMEDLMERRMALLHREDLDKESQYELIDKANVDFYSSVEFVRVVAHEKNHSLQNKSIPLPLREAQSYWIDFQIKKKLSGNNPLAGISMNGFGLAFDRLYKEFGDDLNRLIWGNIEDKFYERVLLDQVKARMTPEFIDGMLLSGYEWKYDSSAN